ncbi:TolC family protein [Delftia sp. PS-11]|uniref:TolC family protein n=1 Tax=Delftia sp. PS-11 TaxID=2767222 RepID=UPI0024557C95|nr:TolC family protein [Delftia sp. PS-11]KAJ8744664.1 TolC family protein [Delftia sp. PS-11]
MASRTVLAGLAPARFQFSPRTALRSALCCLLMGAAAGVAAQAQSVPAASAPGEAASANAQAVPQLSLGEVVRAVLEHNPDLRAVQQSQVSARAGVVTASALPNPKLEWNQGRNSARVPSGASGSVQGWAVALPIENPVLRSARIEAARAGEQGSVHHVANMRNALVAQVRLRAYEMVLREAEVEAAREAVRLLEQAHERVRVRVDSGEAARYEIIKADAEIIQARQLQQTAKLRAEQAQLALGRLAAGQLPVRFRLDVSLEDRLHVDALGNIDPMEHPELRQLKAEVERAQARLDGAKAARLPGMELRYGQTREPDVRQNMLGVSIQIPLLDQHRGPIDEAASELERARLLLEGRQIELRQQTLQAWKELEMARVRTQALSQGAVREAESALRVAEAAYRFGERGILDVLDAQRVLRAVRADLLDARYQLQSARIQLEYLAGRYADPAAL